MRQYLVGSLIDDDDDDDDVAAGAAPASSPATVTSSVSALSAPAPATSASSSAAAGKASTGVTAPYRVTLLYGSQTGMAKRFALRAADLLKGELCIHPRLRLPHAVLICVFMMRMPGWYTGISCSKC